MQFTSRVMWFIEPHDLYLDHIHNRIVKVQTESRLK